MRCFTRFFAILGVWALAYGCGQSEGPAEVHILDFEAGFERAEKINLSEIAREVNYIPLETSDSSLIAFISDIKNDGQTIYLVNRRNSVMMFSNSGEYKGTVKRNGRGPGEYLIINRLFLDDDKTKNSNIGVLDVSSALIYDREGKFLKNLPGVDTVCNSNGNGSGTPYCLDKIPWSDKFSLTHYYFDGENRVEYLDILDSDGNLDTSLYVGQMKTQSKMIEGGEMSLWLPSHKYYYNGNIRVMKGDLDTIYSVGKDMAKSVVYIADFGKYTERAGDLFAPNRIFPISVAVETEKYLIVGFTVNKGDFPASKLDNGSEKSTSEIFLLYNKEDKSIVSLSQDPISALSGFANDIDGGIYFAPKFVDGNRMYQVFDSDFFIEVAEQSNSAKMKEIAAKITEDSNPVLMEVIL